MKARHDLLVLVRAAIVPMDANSRMRSTISAGRAAKGSILRGLGLDLASSVLARRHPRRDTVVYDPASLGV